MLYDKVSLPFLGCLIIIVKKQYTGSSIPACKFKCPDEEVLADGLSPQRMPESSVLDDLIDHIPCIDHTGIITLHEVEDSADIALKSREHRLSVR